MTSRSGYRGDVVASRRWRHWWRHSGRGLDAARGHATAAAVQTCSLVCCHPLLWTTTTHCLCTRKRHNAMSRTVS